MNQQLEIDWNAPKAQPKKQKMLDALVPQCGCVRKVIESTGKPGRGCGCANRLRAILRALDSFQQKNDFCWASVDKIAARVGRNRRNTQRLLRLAEHLGYVTTVQQNRSSSNYSINWLAIWNATEERPATCPEGVNIAHSEGRHFATPEGVNLLTQGRQFDTPEGRQFDAQNSRSLNSREFKHDGNAERPKAKASGFFEGEDQGWHCHLDRVHLTDVEYLITIFAPRAAANKLIPSGRNGEVIVLAAAWIALKGETPGGLFWSLLKQPAKAWMTSAAGEVAINQVKRFRGRQSLAVS